MKFQQLEQEKVVSNKGVRRMKKRVKDGMCECGGTITSTNAVSNKFGTAGIPMAQVIISAFDLKTGEELTYGNRGELRVLSPCVMLGYYKNPEATAQFF